MMDHTVGTTFLYLQLHIQGSRILNKLPGKIVWEIQILPNVLQNQKTIYLLLTVL